MFMMYRLTFLHNDEYSQLRPRDPDSRYSIELEAKNRTEAVEIATKEKQGDFSTRTMSTIPVLWEIKEL
jgi:hypothetical protein